MREFIVGASGQRKHVHILLGGQTNSGKTFMASSFPRPLFISDVSEHGYATLDTMDDDARLRDFWWDPKVKPTVWAIENLGDMPKALLRLEAMCRGGKIPWSTLVVDSISIYAQRVLDELKRADPDEDNRQRYGKLNDALRSLVIRANALPMHVVWLCHVNEEGSLTLPATPAATIPPYMDYKWLCYVQTALNKEADYQVRTRPFRGSTWVGGRGKNLPDPLIPSFKPIAELLGLSERPVSPACPDFGGVSYREGCSYL